MRNKKTTLLLVFLLIVFSFCLVSIDVNADGPKLVPKEGADAAKYNTGDYTLNDMVKVFVSVAQWIIIISGSLALLAFVVGGFMFILSGGNREMVEKGKGAIIGATIGLLVVLLAFTAVNYLMDKIDYAGGPFGAWNSTQ